MDARQKAELLAATLDSMQAKSLLEEFSSKKPVEYRTLQEKLFYYGNDGLAHHLNILLRRDIVTPGPYNLKGESTYVANEEFNVDGKPAIDIVCGGVRTEDARWRKELGPIGLRKYDIELMMKQIGPMSALIHEHPLPYEAFIKLPGMNNYTNRLELDNRNMLEFSTTYDGAHNLAKTNLVELTDFAKNMMLKIFGHKQLSAYGESILK